MNTHLYFIGGNYIWRWQVRREDKENTKEYRCAQRCMRGCQRAGIKTRQVAFNHTGTS